MKSLTVGVSLMLAMLGSQAASVAARFMLLFLRDPSASWGGDRTVPWE
jgi:hypothetical protein